MSTQSVQDLVGSPLTTEKRGDTLVFTNAPSRSEMLKIKNRANTNAADTTNTDDLQTGGSLGLALNGSGFTVGVYDIGYVLKTHQEFTVSASDSTSRVSFPGGANITSGWGDHATHVAGTIGARGADADAKGMATAVSIYSADVNASSFNDFHNTLTSSDWYNNALNFIASNHSYGANAGWEYVNWSNDIGYIYVWYGIIEDHINNSSEDNSFGKYNSNSRNVDRAAYVRTDCLQCWAAGNDRNDNYGGLPTSLTHSGTTYDYPIIVYSSYNNAWTLVSTFLDGTTRKFTWNNVSYAIPGSDGQDNGYDTLLNGGTVAKNVLTVGAVNDITADPITAISETAFSGYGPCDDGRIKPDVVGNGASLYSPIDTNDTAYAQYSGTSMATPNVTGTVVLLTELYKSLTSNSTIRSATMRGLLCFTANNNLADSKPSYSLGYGVVDAKAAAQYLQSWNSNDYDHIKEYAHITSETNVIVKVNNASNKIRALLVWNDYTDATTPLPDDAEDDKTFVVTAAGGKFYIDGVVNPVLTLYRGNTYTFDQSDSSNTSHPLYFSETADGTHAQTDTTYTVSSSGSSYYIVDGSNQPNLTFYTGRTYTFSLGGTQSGHPLKIGTSADTNSHLTTGVTYGETTTQFSPTTTGTYYYYCDYHSGMGGTITVLEGASKYTSGFTESGTPGTANAHTKIVISNDSPTLYYYCHNHSGMGNTANTTHYSSVDEERNPAIVNKLRLSGGLYGGSTDYYPYSLDKANPSVAATNSAYNTRDNVQLMEFDATADTQYNIRVDFDQAGGHSITGTQPFTLFIENATEVPDESAICFLKGTPVRTDQGEIPIEQITNKNTINGLNVVGIVESLNQEAYMVNVTKNSLGSNIPSQDTLITPTHGIYIDNTTKLVEQHGHLVQAKYLINDDNILKVDTGKILVYNVLLKKHAPMIVNNMIVETLHPSHRLAVKFRASNHVRNTNNKRTIYIPR